MNDQILSSSSEEMNDKPLFRRSRFMEELYSIIERKQYPDLIRWSSDGKSFIISNPEGFEQIVLPQICHHSNFSSFIRQLNMYRFKKKSVRGSISYTNPFFIKGHSELLEKIIRKNPRKEAQSRKDQRQKMEKEFLIRNQEEKRTQQEASTNNFDEINFSETERTSAPIDFSFPMKDFTNASKYELEVLSMIRNYLKDDEDNDEFGNNDQQNSSYFGYDSYKKVKTAPESHLENQWVKMELITRDHHLQGNNKSDSQVSKSSYLFRATDYYECQNLISAISKYRNEEYYLNCNTSTEITLTPESY